MQRDPAAGPSPRQAAAAAPSPFKVWVHVCDNCGTRMFEKHCKIRCPNCGYIRDCSDP